MKADATNPPPLGLTGTVLLFGAAGLLLFAATDVAIPALAARTALEPVVLWFLSATVIVFGPLLVISLLMLWREGVLRQSRLWRDRLRFRPMTRADWLWSLGGLAVVGLCMAVTVPALRLAWGDGVRLHPPFLVMEPLTPERYWILAAWLPFWVVNILGEEILWHGIVLPRHETAFGRWAWLVNGLAWLSFHLAFGPVLFLTLAPTTLIIPYAVQRRQNTWIGVVIHGGLNGPGFIAVAFGLA